METISCMEALHEDPLGFEDYFPSMVDTLGVERFMEELYNGFCLLMDVSVGLITFESLKRNTTLMGLNELRDDELVCMLAEGDLDGDGALNQMEFCSLMFRLSPGLMMEESQPGDLRVSS
ncbi:Calcium-binding protein PBP1 [Capsicum chinense]|nr:Calcium-binding protein PBP1 [Capsicum annuum]KAF3657991.1 Calcium-binding protein PBP1 [Capsicum annuum]PHU13093.1 Calcium-binding protein PBP1 [Capsicum chinense]